jgi:hypothetical protein
MNNLSNLEMQSFLFLMQNPQCNILRKENEEIKRMLFVNFLLNMRRKQNPMQMYLSFSYIKQKKQ